MNILTSLTVSTLSGSGTRIVVVSPTGALTAVTSLPSGALDVGIPIGSTTANTGAFTTLSCSSMTVTGASSGALIMANGSPIKFSQAADVPTATAGCKIRLWGSVEFGGYNSGTDYAIGIESANMWFNTDGATTGGFKFYKQGAIKAWIDGNGIYHYNSYTTSSTWERACMEWSSSRLRIGAQAIGSGVLRGVDFVGSDFTFIVTDTAANTANQNLGYFKYIWNPSANDTTYFRSALNVELFKSGTKSLSGSAPLRTLRMAYGITDPSTTGTVSEAVGFSSVVFNVSAGATIQYAYGAKIDSPVVSGGTINTAYGLVIDAQTVSGVGSGWGIHQKGTSDFNLFQGKVAIGNTGTINSLLEVRATNSGGNPAVLISVPNTTSATRMLSFGAPGGVEWAIWMGTESIPYFYIGGNSGVGTYFWRANWSDTTVPANSFKSASGTAGQVVLAVIGATGQTANLQQWITNGVVLSAMDSNGRLGLGTQTPNANHLLHISRSSSLANPYGLLIENINTGGAGIQLRNSRLAANNNWQFFITNDTVPKFKIGQDNVADYITILPSSGNVGIGDANPAVALSVVGDISLRRDNIASSAGGLTLVNTTPATSTVQQPSPYISWIGSGWKTATTASSQTVEFRSSVFTSSAFAAPVAELRFSYSINGGALQTVLRLLTNGSLNATIGSFLSVESSNVYCAYANVEYLESPDANIAHIYSANANLDSVAAIEIYSDTMSTLSMETDYLSTPSITVNNSYLGFFGATPIAKPVVSGSHYSTPALVSLLEALRDLGIITDMTD